MFSPQEIREKLADRNLSEVARRTGLHYNVVYRFANVEDEKMPTYRTVKALSDYLEGGE